MDEPILHYETYVMVRSDLIPSYTGRARYLTMTYLEYEAWLRDLEVTEEELIEFAGNIL